MANIKHRLSQVHPRQTLVSQQVGLQVLEKALTAQMQQQLQQQSTKLQSVARTLNAVNPLSTLERGFAVVTVDEHAIDTVTKIPVGSTTKVYLDDGSITATVTHQEPGNTLLNNRGKPA